MRTQPAASSSSGSKRQSRCVRARVCVRVCNIPTYPHPPRTVTHISIYLPVHPHPTNHNAPHAQKPLPPGLASPVPPPPRLLCNPGPLYTIPSTAPDPPPLDTSKTKPTQQQAPSLPFAPYSPTAAGPAPAATTTTTTTTATATMDSASGGVLRGMQAVFLAADAEEVDRLQTLRPPPRPEASV